MMLRSRRAAKGHLRTLLWLLPLLSLALASWACSGSVSPPPVTHLPASQLRLNIQIFGQYSGESDVQTWIEILDATSGRSYSLADKAHLTCNGSDVKPSYPDNPKRPCPRQPPGGAYRFIYTDEHGAQTTVVVPVPAGSFTILSPRDGSTVYIPGDGALAVQFTLPIPPPHSRPAQLNVVASCQPTPSATCYSVENSFPMDASPTPTEGFSSPTTIVNHDPPTPTPNGSRPTATVYENRGPPTPTPPPGATPTAPPFDGTVIRTGGLGTVTLVGDYTSFRPGPGHIGLYITLQFAPDPGAFASVFVTMDSATSDNITWVR